MLDNFYVDISKSCDQGLVCLWYLNDDIAIFCLIFVLLQCNQLLDCLLTCSHMFGSRASMFNSNFWFHHEKNVTKFLTSKICNTHVLILHCKFISKIPCLLPLCEKKAFFLLFDHFKLIKSISSKQHDPQLPLPSNQKTEKDS